jgi:hypothetical protein
MGWIKKNQPKKSVAISKIFFYCEPRFFFIVSQNHREELQKQSPTNVIKNNVVKFHGKKRSNNI